MEKSKETVKTGWFGLVKLVDVGDTLVSKKGTAWRRVAVMADGKAWNFSEFPQQGQKLAPLVEGKVHRAEIFGLDAEKSEARGRILDVVA